MKCSVAMTTYNGEKYIIEQLDSLRLQTVSISELIICDDRSSDRTVDLIQKYINKYKLENNWHLYLNEKNLGYEDNFHKAASLCNGDIILFCDQDDIWKKDKVEIIQALFSAHPQISVLCSGYRNFISGTEQVSFSYSDNCPDNLEQILLNSESMYLQSIGSAMAVRFNFWKSMQQYWYPGFAHDEFLWKLGLVNESIYKISKVLMDRRCHGNNTSFQKMRSRNKRIQYVRKLESSFRSMFAALTDKMDYNTKTSKLLQHHITACQYRLQMLERHKCWYFIPLIIKYKDTVKTIRTLMIEVLYSLHV